MKKTWYIIFIALFFAACIVPSLGMLIAGPSPAAANEAPVVTPKLKNWDGSPNDDILTDLRDYMSNGFYLRLTCITGWNEICANLLKTSANADVILGPNGWLFYKDSADTYAGADILTEREIWCCARSLYLLQEAAEQAGAQFLFVSPQGKETLYPEQMYDYVQVSDERNRLLLGEKLDEMGVHWADMYTPYVTRQEQLSYSWDSHWNLKGAALGADIILSALGHESDYYAGPFEVTELHKGDLYEMLFPASGKLETDYVWLPGFTFTYVSAFHSSDDMIIQTENDAGKGSVLMYRDSSGRNLYAYIAQSYVSAVFSRSNTYNMFSIVDYAATDVVVELADRNLGYILKYPGVYAAPERDAAMLNRALSVSTELTVTTDPNVPGYVKLTGSLPENVADDSPVYLRLEGTVYEAIPAADSFTAWVREDIDTQGAEVFAFAG